MFYSTGLRNGMLVTGSFRSLMNDCRIRIYAGPTIPENADVALPGDETLMYEFTVGDDGSTDLTWASTAAGGVVLKASAEAWQSTADAAGDMAFFRVYVPPDNPSTLSTTAARMQGTVGTAGADLLVTNVTKALSDPFTLDYFAVAIPESF